MVAGVGDRLLAMAARHADIVGIATMRDELGIGYFTFNLTPSVSWDTLEKLLSALK